MAKKVKEKEKKDKQEKKEYETPELEFIEISEIDCIMTSGIVSFWTEEDKDDTEW